MSNDAAIFLCGTEAVDFMWIVKMLCLVVYSIKIRVLLSSVQSRIVIKEFPSLFTLSYPCFAFLAMIFSSPDGLIVIIFSALFISPSL